MEMEHKTLWTPNVGSWDTTCRIYRCKVVRHQFCLMLYIHPLNCRYIPHRPMRVLLGPDAPPWSMSQVEDFSCPKHHLLDVCWRRFPNGWVMVNWDISTAKIEWVPAVIVRGLVSWIGWFTDTVLSKCARTASLVFSFSLTALLFM